eukprot:augustus_masked-scaffold_13-processed-gene-7.48-mRNA-1 protein AED:1.00 eAED:1.00 QI:0/0/0/0/1/1/2/0/150
MTDQGTSENIPNQVSETSPTDEQNDSNNSPLDESPQPPLPADEGPNRERGRLERMSKQLTEREAENEDLRNSLMEQKEANDQLQDILRRRQEELEEREAYFKEQEAQQAERMSNLPESYEDAAEDEALEHREYPKEKDKAKNDTESAMSY